MHPAENKSVKIEQLKDFAIDEIENFVEDAKEQIKNIDKISNIFKQTIFLSPNLVENKLKENSIDPKSIAGRGFVFLNKIYNDPDHLNISKINGMPQTLHAFHNFMFEKFNECLGVNLAINAEPNQPAQEKEPIQHKETIQPIQAKRNPLFEAPSKDNLSELEILLLNPDFEFRTILRRALDAVSPVTNLRNW